ncbi:MAG: CoA-transferase [Deltaproteobacteria bacterium]|jgi:acyl CoA:acetate/3-ketoacid CoA transferase beta subunit|nr:CoA-transferase [Deltaproteobacteria bacterium]MBW2500371.1 CoA-transferase [Deltaproteobacteria bacterium]
MSDATRAEICAVAVAEAFRGDGEVLASSFGTIPAVGARLAKATFEPELMMTDGVCTVIEEPLPVSGPASEPVVEAWLPFRTIFDHVWNGKRHVVMVASQIDRFGNQNFACIGDHAKPKAQLLGMRGAPGNTVSHTTSYWVPNQTAKVFVEKVDVVSGVGWDRAAKLSPAIRKALEIRFVISNLAVYDFQTPDHAMRLRSVHPGVTVDQVVENTGFELVIEGDVPETRLPTAEELSIMREKIDPKGFGEKEVPNPG